VLELAGGHVQPLLACRRSSCQQLLCGSRVVLQLLFRVQPGTKMQHCLSCPCAVLVMHSCCCLLPVVVCIKVKLLVDVGAADPCLPDRWQQTALDEARKSGALPVVSYLATKVPGGEGACLAGLVCVHVFL
jgi:hypothetical protein